MADEAGLTVDRAGYEQAMEEAKDKARGRAEEDRHHGRSRASCRKTDDSPKYGPPTTTAKVVGWVKDNTVVRDGQPARRRRRSPCCSTGPTSTPSRAARSATSARITADRHDFEVEDTQRLGDSVLHIGGVLTDGDDQGRPDGRRCDGHATASNTMRNHTATHLLNWPCARCSATTSSRRARSSMPRRRASTSPTTSR